MEAVLKNVCGFPVLLICIMFQNVQLLMIKFAVCFVSVNREKGNFLKTGIS